MKGVTPDRLQSAKDTLAALEEMASWKLIDRAPWVAVHRLRKAIRAARRDVRRYSGMLQEEAAAGETLHLPEIGASQFEERLP